MKCKIPLLRPILNASEPEGSTCKGDRVLGYNIFVVPNLHFMASDQFHTF
jgi:hypothetical protein